MLKVVREQIELDFRDFLPRIEIPVLAIYGRHDPYYPVELGEWIAEQCPRGEHVSSRRAPTTRSSRRRSASPQVARGVRYA